MLKINPSETEKRLIHFEKMISERKPFNLSFAEYFKQHPLDEERATKVVEFLKKVNVDSVNDQLIAKIYAYAMRPEHLQKLIHSTQSHLEGMLEVEDESSMPLSCKVNTTVVVVLDFDHKKLKPGYEHQAHRKIRSTLTDLMGKAITGWGTEDFFNGLITMDFDPSRTPVERNRAIKKVLDTLAQFMN